MLAGRAAEREQPLLDQVERVRIDRSAIERLLDRARRGVERDQDAVDRLEAGFDQVGRLPGATFEPAEQRREGRGRGAVARDRLVRLAKVARNLGGLLHRRAALAQPLFLARLGSELGQFGLDVMEIFGVGARLVETLALLDMQSLRRPPCREGGAHLPQPGLEPSEGVEQGAVLRGVDECTVVVLAMEFDEMPADVAQGLGADRRVVEVGAGTTVGELHASQDEAAVGLEVL